MPAEAEFMQLQREKISRCFALVRCRAGAQGLNAALSYDVSLTKHGSALRWAFGGHADRCQQSSSTGLCSEQAEPFKLLVALHCLSPGRHFSHYRRLDSLRIYDRQPAVCKHASAKGDCQQ